ncbi:MAG: hypothetical protein IJ360_01110 [Clostridia bacterium]|nr:hypothetical protein [Clostridia bacterium]
MNIENINTAIKNLSAKRKIFHSEADFQFAFAWELQKELPQAEIRLEYCPAFAKDMHIDIFVIESGATYPIELKYKSKKIQTIDNNDFFSLKNHGAQDINRHAFLYDVERLEKMKALDKSFSMGYAVMLTNDPLYWRKPLKNASIDEAFKIHEGKTVFGTLKWSEQAAAGTTKGHNTIVLNNSYVMHWSNFSDIEDVKNGMFMYNVVEVK